jgi:predicted RNase H-like HicB family nuclease
VAYNGLNDRVSQTVGATTTNFALDVAGGLPEVISTTKGTAYLHLPGGIMAQGLNLPDETKSRVLDSRSHLRYDPYRGGVPLMQFTIEYEQEADGRWLAEVLELPGVLAYGQTVQQAIARVQALALRVLADRLEHGEAIATVMTVSFAAAA